MNRTQIENYYHGGEGYAPFIINDGWQVAQLNYMPELDMAAITRLEKHEQTDEVFVLTKGRAVLISADIIGNAHNFQLVKMKTGVTYNVPQGVWHTVTLDKDAEIIIVEKNETHLNDCIYYFLDDAAQQRLRAAIGDDM